MAKGYSNDATSTDTVITGLRHIVQRRVNENGLSNGVSSVINGFSKVIGIFLAGYCGRLKWAL